MARIAYLFSGLTRQWSYCIQSHFRLFQKNEVDVFFHFWDPMDEAEKQRIVAAYKPRAYRFQPQVDFSEYDTKATHLDRINPPSRMMSQYYSWKQVGEIFREYLGSNGTKYDFAVRLRADLMFFHSLDDVLPHLGPGDLMLSSFNNFGLVNDMFALGGIEPVLYYLTLFDHALEYNSAVPFNPEFLLIRHLNLNAAKINIRMSDLIMLVFRPHMVGMPIQECLKEHPGMSKWRDPEIVDAHKAFHGRRSGVAGLQHVEQFKNAQLMQLEQSKRKNLFIGSVPPKPMA